MITFPKNSGPICSKTIRYTVRECSLGVVLVAATERGLCAILLGDDREALVKDLQRRFRTARLTSGDAALDELVATVVRFVEKPGSGFDAPLDLHGTEFQRRVWEVLREIPAGSTTSYADVAARAGVPKAVRAVASAIGANPIAVAVPCHRVLHTGGGISGYRWGIERKRALLEREKLAA